jgi:hypothetical protein
MNIEQQRREIAKSLTNTKLSDLSEKEKAEIKAAWHPTCKQCGTPLTVTVRTKSVKRYCDERCRTLSRGHKSRQDPGWDQDLAVYALSRAWV